ncbi:glycine cleavage system aminomethyltransferase GcvT [Rhodoplanes sp. TEM]|uniref:aminomethyltransferase n=1 Tax=Rhodoplanes tepidamans TaxID=200616 RepID=A0ABT5JIB0_RHOTP|nr:MULTISPECIES: glycine cleavage system aminomethyltransferase GcvT [Rhodoplanes]MDC7789096.1 glycine cleavage system aminomethyltransferase GcvT [Rhodoplanes tepidamans]MDC7985889.1 glycine cleavage system aminomethyltransferase GcvT [Rhodoplanes sp. TEM]MDQ0354418.1 aminomethyltransferase [Rhodoplanes tepidamans]
MTETAPETAPETSGATSPAALARTPLDALHRRLGARMVPFAGYAMPVQYPAGILQEHLHTREKAGLFDVSHMGQLVLRAPSGKAEDAARALETLVPADIVSLAPGRQRYALLTDDAGGIRDDLMVSNQGDHLFVVVNAACKVADEAHLRDGLAGLCTVEPLADRALVALQGPRAEAALAALAPEVAAMRFMDARPVTILGAACLVSRSGYTGEDGYEISIPADRVEEICETLLNTPDVALIGLGARDSLRLEAGLCLYGSDLDTTTTPVEAALEWSIQKARRTGGARAGGFPGADVILRQLAEGATRRRVGLLPEGRAPVRAHTALYRDAEAGAPAGEVTSGGFGPSIGAPVAMGYVPVADAAVGTLLHADVRGRRLPVRVAAMPVVPNRYKRP